MSQSNQVKTDLERRLHTRLNQAWLDACLAFLSQSLSSGLPPLTQLSKLVEDQLILSSLDQSTLGCLPPNLSTSHGQIIKGEYLVQVQDCINVSEPRDRRFLHSAHRTLKLGLYDGIQAVSAMELTHIPQLSIDFPAGFKIILKDPKTVHGMLVLTKENVTVLGGRVEQLVQHREALKAATQKSTLPQEWKDFLGNIDELPTDMRLEGDTPDHGPELPALDQVTAAYSALKTTTATLESNESLWHQSLGSTSANKPTYTAPTSTVAFRATPIPLGLNDRRFATTTTSSTTSTSNTASTTSYNPVPASSSLPSAFSGSKPIASSSAMDIDEHGIEDDAYFDDSLLEQAELIAKSRKSATSQPPASAPTVPAEDMEDDAVSEEVPLKDIVESVDEQIARIESSQEARHAVFSSQHYPITEWDVPDIEDYYQPDYDAPNSQELIEPPEDDETDSGKHGFSYRSRSGLREEGDYNDSETILKRRKLAEPEESHPKLEHDFHAFQSDSAVEVDSEDDLVVMTSQEFATQTERNAEVRLISELRSVNRDRKYRLHVTCLEFPIPSVEDNQIMWTVPLQDASEEILNARVSSSICESLLDMSINEWIVVTSEPMNMDLVSATMDRAQNILSNVLVIQWDKAERCWTIISIDS